MYDQKGYKKRFLDSLEKDQFPYRSIFRKFENQEHARGIDILDMNILDLTEVFKETHYTSNIELAAMHSRIKSYFSFHKKILMFDRDDLRKLCIQTENQILTHPQIIKLEMAINQSLPNSWYYNALVYCVFRGFRVLNLKDIVNLRTPMINFEENIIEFEDKRILVMSPDISRYLKEMIEHNGAYGNGCHEGVHHDSVFKVQVYSNTKDIEKALILTIRRTALNKINKVTDLNVDITKIHYSGLYYFVSEKAREQGIEMKDFFDAEKNSYLNLLLQSYIIEFGSAMTIGNFKFQFKDIAYTTN